MRRLFSLVSVKSPTYLPVKRAYRDGGTLQRDFYLLTVMEDLSGWVQIQIVQRRNARLQPAGFIVPIGFEHVVGEVASILKTREVRWTFPAILIDFEVAALQSSRHRDRSSLREARQGSVGERCYRHCRGLQRRVRYEE